MKKVLLVNDSKFESMILKDMLVSIGYIAGIADEYDAIEKVQDMRPDYIIINRVMKEIYGDELASKIKARFPEIKCILSSCDSISIDDYKNSGIDAVIRTPVDQYRLKAVLKNVEYLKNDIRK
ncbi:MAG TPA: response regulator [Hungateiclostridium thermocellum]|jgi:CheY-like chemotaxis protein|uniref:Stage 0 sporulation protein A homolog n=2 Tax=Acetivibrio thermocellus TaxID=1515 RepID=A3DBS9_ACET2|nr:response regulator [Acetivibrio thermocellus]CDG34846.1 response regulator receiver protein [Acetivibrio thermocellus BC1]ABN51408.1 response regulator receiver [Acetivibrio thermocellus ATCC 27405]ADU75107.1 response regulator receiver [Acetivibrio thermocellus DSM 1313]ALX09083.1 response regulator receiver protein [Acetivibrio thermocellus AD2]ANV76834.1 response regulator receiver protein [Acetivibrio thermocellus DSM 2360]